jgi:DNA-binding LacI/PurR family transcriptional regulator
MSVTGFDNLDIGRKLHPTLTTIDQNSPQLMARAGELVLQQIRPGAEERTAAIAETVAPSLVIGESTGPAPIGR